MMLHSTGSVLESYSLMVDMTQSYLLACQHTSLGRRSFAALCRFSITTEKEPSLERRDIVSHEILKPEVCRVYIKLEQHHSTYDQIVSATWQVG